MELQGCQWIAGEASREGAERFRAVEATTGESLGLDVFEATDSEIDRAVEAAARAHRARALDDTEVRARLLEAIAEGIETLGDPLIERAGLETALPTARLVGERGRTCGQLRLFAAHLRSGGGLAPKIEPAEPERQPLPKPDLRTVRRPVGPVAVFGASNFPLAFSVAGGDTASALAAGCPVVVKAHPYHPGTSELVGRVIVEAVAALGLDPGVFSLVQGASHRVGTRLVGHPALRAVGFTGSLVGGKALFDLAAARPRPIPVYAEMGSVNPVFLLPGALAERGEALAEGLVTSVTLGVGQFCTNPGLLVALEGEAIEALAGALAEGLDVAEPGTMLHPNIRRAYDAGLTRLAAVQGVEPLGSVASNGDGPGHTPAVLHRTDAKTLLAHSELAEEVFGPSTLLVTCRDDAELLAVAEALEGQLTATLHATTADLERWPSLVSVLEDVAGRLVFGGFPTGVEVCHAMHHGGPFPATTHAASTSVGTVAMDRFTRPVCYQDAPPSALPAELVDS